MTTEPPREPAEFSIDQALSRFDLLIDRLASPTGEVDITKSGITESGEVETAGGEVAEREASVLVEEPANTAVKAKAPARAKVRTPARAAEPSVAEKLPLLADVRAAASDLDESEMAPVVLSISGLVKRFGDTAAVDGIDLTVRAGQIFGIVGPNGAGKTTTLSIVTGVLRPDEGTVTVNGADVWRDPVAAKRTMGILPDRFMLFDRLTGRQLLYYSGMLRGLDRATVKSRSADLIRSFGLEEAQDRLVADYSAGMTRKVALAAAMIHSPRLLILDEPFESVDAVSVATVLTILRSYAAAGGTVVLSSHSMDLVEDFCDSVAVVAEGRILTTGPTHEVRGDASLEERFIALIGGISPGEDMEWLRSFSD